MMAEHEQDDDCDGELADVRPVDILRIAFAGAIRAIGEALGDGEAFQIAARAIVEAETKTRLALRRRVLN